MELDAICQMQCASLWQDKAVRSADEEIALDLRPVLEAGAHLATNVPLNATQPLLNITGRSRRCASSHSTSCNWFRFIHESRRAVTPGVSAHVNPADHFAIAVSEHGLLTGDALGTGQAVRGPAPNALRPFGAVPR